jgi:serine/threonine protein kinase
LPAKVFAVQGDTIKIETELKSLRKVKYNSANEFLKNIRHANILKLLGFCKTDNQIIILMPLEDKSLKLTMSEKINQNVWFNLEDLQFFAREIIKGLDYLHLMKVPHGNIKVQLSRITLALLQHKFKTLD